MRGTISSKKQKKKIDAYVLNRLLTVSQLPFTCLSTAAHARIIHKSSTDLRRPQVGADTSLTSAGRRQLAQTCVARSLFGPHRSVLADLDKLLAAVGGGSGPAAETFGRAQAPTTLLLGYKMTST